MFERLSVITSGFNRDRTRRLIDDGLIRNQLITIIVPRYPSGSQSGFAAMEYDVNTKLGHRKVKEPRRQLPVVPQPGDSGRTVLEDR